MTQEYVFVALYNKSYYKILIVWYLAGNTLTESNNLLVISLKGQSSVYLLIPTPDQEYVFIVFVSCAFVFKFLNLLHLIICQVTTDIFLIDWERPKAQRPQKNGAMSDMPVSIWRTYFVANEWNELQAQRRINGPLQIFAAVFFMSVIGLENIASSDPRSDATQQGDTYYAYKSRMLLFALGGLVYLIFGGFLTYLLDFWLIYKSVFFFILFEIIEHIITVCYSKIKCVI